MGKNLLSHEEQIFIKKISADLKFYKEYKSFMADVKTIFLNKGPEAARSFIHDKADDIIQSACDEMFYDLFSDSM